MDHFHGVAISGSSLGQGCLPTSVEYMYQNREPTGYSLETDAIERKPRQLADLDLPLHQRIRVRVAMNAQQQETLALLVVAIVSIQHLSKKSCQLHVLVR